MKSHTQGEREEAKKKLPKPLYDFLGSTSLTNIYIGIQKKHALNLRQLLLFTEIANLTLLGLESESALETNLHQAMHELSNQGARELVADINDRVFKEASRRVKENIPEPSVWTEKPSEPELSEEERAEEVRRKEIENMPDDDPRLLAEYEKDRAEAAKRDEENKKELAFALEQAKKDPIIPETDEDDVDIEEASDSTVLGDQTIPSIVEQKLGVPSQTQTTSNPTVEIQPETAEVESKQLSTTPPPSKPAYKGGVDPYREPVE